MNTAIARDSTVTPSVKTAGSFDSPRAPRNHVKPTSASSRPVRLSGRRRAAMAPLPMKAQPRRRPRTLVRRGCVSWSLVRTRVSAIAPATSPPSV